MGMIAYFGNERFEVSRKKVLTMQNIKRTTAGRFGSSERIGLKPLTQFEGPGLSTFTYTVPLNSSLGVSPGDILDHWRDLADQGKADILVVGGRLAGKYKWTLKSVDESWDVLDGGGNVLTAAMGLTFEEYVE